MNNKGFTLVEILAVIAIIGILAIMITPGVFSMRESVLESAYENKIAQIEAAARDYGTEHITELKSPVQYVYDNSKQGSSDCIYRTVNFLINNGYLKASNSYAEEGVDNTDFTDPRTNESMNGRSVCIRFDNNSALKREIIAYVVEE